MLPDFNFLNLPLSQPARSQLAQIYKSVRKHANAARSRTSLLQLLVENAYDPIKGTYVPFTKGTASRKLPMASENLRYRVGYPIDPFPHSYFTNGLVIPDGYGTKGFDKYKALSPISRATNIGFLVVTIELDCETREQFEETLASTRPENHPPFAAVDKELCRFKDYRGYSIVFTGNRSLHFHFVFSTQHLDNVPWQANLAIADMVREMDRVTTFQGAKGRNDLKEKDIWIILTYLNGEKYAELNVIGQWLGIPTIIELHYQDLINQSVGRNRGFRQSLTRDTKTAVVCTPYPRLWKFLRTLPESRVVLEPQTGSGWRAAGALGFEGTPMKDLP